MDAEEKIQELERRVKSLRHHMNALRKQTAFATRQLFWERDEWLDQACGSRRGPRCFLLGCGPSLNRLDLTKLRGESVMACNGAFLLEGFQTEYYITVSHYFYKGSAEAIKRMACRRRFLPHYLRELDSDAPTSWLNTAEEDEYASFSNLKPYAFSHDPAQRIYLGGTVIFPALQILNFLGFEEVVLLGVDHDYGPEQRRGEAYFVASDRLQAHFQPDYYQSPTNVHIDFPAMERAYALAKEAFEKSKRRILNASPGTKLETFPVVDYATLF